MPDSDPGRVRPNPQTRTRIVRALWILAAIAAIVAVGVGVGVACLPLPWSWTTHIHSETDIARTPAEVFRFVTTPSSWPSWHPSSLGVSGATDHPLAVGEAVTEQFRVAGREGTVTWTVVAREPDHRWVIRGAVAGGGEGVITYTLVARAGGTHFERDFDYSFRRPLLIAVNRLRIRDRVTAESAEALRRLRAVLESSGSR